MEIAMETLVTELILNGGEAKSKAMEAMAAARERNFEEAEVKLREAGEALGKAHEFQTRLIWQEADGNKLDFSMILIHGQDHLMNAITVRDLAEEIVGLYKSIAALDTAKGERG
ncbi:MAG: PTS lactose/cellobiose transporter subunit IIA [Lachnospiraceae bacterium]|jgi:PTS system cellobiose-specific IIA component|nr:PTS lactose/cellobiose transporter subunit IIA [Lachnospiraceae bacterium]